MTHNEHRRAISPTRAASLVQEAFRGTPRSADLGGLAREHGVTLHLTGGFVRDAVAGRGPSRDIDVTPGAATKSLAQRWARLIRGRLITLDEDNGVYRVARRSGGRLWYWDFTALRAAGIEADLRLRDFTVNALAWPLFPPGASLLDPTGGLGDMAARVIRHTHPGVFADDPLRRLRACRLAARLGYRIHGRTAALLPGPDLLGAVAGERIREELGLLLESPASTGLLEIVAAAGFLSSLWLPHGPDLDRCRRLEAMVAALPGGPLEGFASLADLLGRAGTHGLGRLALLKILALLFPPADEDRKDSRRRLSEAARELCIGRDNQRFLLAAHDASRDLEEGDPTESLEGPWRFFDRHGRAGLGALVLAAAGPAGTGTRHLELARFFEQDYLPDVAADSLLSAGEIARMGGTAPGPELGRLIERLRMARRLGAVTCREEAEAFVRSQRARRGTP